MSTINQLRCKIKSFKELKAQMESIEQWMVEYKKNKRADVFKEVKRPCKEFCFSTGILKGALAKGRDEVKNEQD